MVIFLSMLFSSILWARDRPAFLNFAVNAGPYLPDFDNSKKANGEKIFPIYRCMFGQFDGNEIKNNPWQPIFGLDLSFFLAQGDAGSLGLGGGANYMYAGGLALAEQYNGAIPNGCGTQLNQKVDLHLFQLHFPQVSYFLDFYQNDFPLFPYVRAGFVTSLYVFGFDAKLEPKGSSEPLGLNNIGPSFGYEFALGLMFLFDVAEPNVAAEARANGVYNHTYLRAELGYMSVDNFGLRGANLSSSGILGAPFPLVFSGAFVMQF